MKLVSIVVPIYNTEPYLHRCVESICAQTYKNLEIILVDDGSTDNCPRLCDEWALKDDRIKVIHKANGGQGYARNTGLDCITGEYVAFIDSDDWIGPNHIAVFYQAITEGKADVVIGAHTSVNKAGISTAHPLRIKEGIYKNREVFDEILLPLIGAEADASSDVALESSSSMSLYSADIIRRNHLRFVSERAIIAEDFFFNFDFFVHCERVAVVNTCDYFYVINTESTSWRYDPNRFVRTKAFYDALWERIERYALEDCVSNRADRTFLMKVRIAVRNIVRSDIKRSRKLKEIQCILTDDRVVTVMQRYPIESYGLGQRILARMMHTGNVIGVYCLMKLRDGLGRKDIAKKFLCRIGIGKS